ncbi:hypothetical protein PGT21_019839 [Puccinia graminis f. sp. tritici]|uniref:Uncharacterized protein n=1 Tax=Puccinia graminis f. sp. tritici TaxID=56615 RepID=A0A5B0N0Y2_PUCGR|nr:hypothetical protein PGT21_019839 [Puccinia graminis f. sp. tritici]KAA1124162.1 hypothetical protein PGTUg99_030632 [Puccinia graminis f. sp. tritici]
MKGTIPFQLGAYYMKPESIRTLIKNEVDRTDSAVVFFSLAIAEFSWRHLPASDNSGACKLQTHDHQLFRLGLLCRLVAPVHAFFPSAPRPANRTCSSRSPIVYLMDWLLSGNRPGNLMPMDRNC